MNSFLVRWMRVVLPNSIFAWVWLLGEIVIESIYLMILLKGWRPDEDFFRNARLTFLGLGAGVYGVSRVGLFHPALNEQYRTWLESTPWTVSKPLPGGPLGLVPQDLIVIGALMGLARETSAAVLALPVIFLVTYLLMLAICSRLCGDWPFAYLLGFGLGAIALVIRSMPFSLLVAVTCCPLALIAVQRSLKRFPWPIDFKALVKVTKPNQEEWYADRLGWPHDFLSPTPPQIWLPYSDGVCLSLLVGWYTFVVHWHIEGLGRAAVCAGAIQTMGVALLIRIGNYMRAHREPIDLPGRIFTLRWIVPGYDVIYVAPLLAGLVQVAAQAGAIALLFANGPRGNLNNPALDWVAVGVSVSGVAGSLMILLMMGPGLEKWRLTGKHRIVFDATQKQAASSFVEL